MRFRTLLVSLAGLAAFAGGCGPSDSPVSLDKYQTNESQEAPAGLAPSTAEPPSAPAEEPPPPVPTSTQTNSVTPTTPVIPEPEVLKFPGVLPATETANKLIRIKTAKGDIVFELLPKEGPNAASNFVYLAKRKFYDGLTFHRVVPGFVIQGGDPLGTGLGDPGYRFKDDPVRLPYDAGIVAMANAGPDTNGSQFFIMLENNPLPPNYSIFGRVVKGMDVVRKIAIGDVMTSVTIENKK